MYIVTVSLALLISSVATGTLTQGMKQVDKSMRHLQG